MIKIPKPIMPTQEEMEAYANKWWERQADVSFHAWNDVLMSHSFDMRIVMFPTPLIESVLALTDGGKQSREQRLPQVVIAFEELIKKPLIDMGCEGSFFFKLISRSPKDYLADDDDFGKPRPIHNAHELVDSLCSSMRTFEDMVSLRHLPEVAALVIRPFIEFSASDEWRVFVVDGKIVAITQYYYFDHFPDLTPEKVSLVEICIRKFNDEVVVPNMKVKTFVADYITDGEVIKILETNPYGLSDPCLFTYDEFDGSIRWVK